MTERRLQGHLILRDSRSGDQNAAKAETHRIKREIASAKASIAAGNYVWELRQEDNDYIIDIYEREPEPVG